MNVFRGGEREEGEEEGNEEEEGTKRSNGDVRNFCACAILNRDSTAPLEGINRALRPQEFSGRPGFDNYVHNYALYLSQSKSCAPNFLFQIPQSRLQQVLEKLFIF